VTTYKRVSRDANHVSIVRELEAAFISVTDTAMVGAGFPDIVVGAFGVTLLVELKSSRKINHRKKGEARNAKQIEFAKTWKGAPVLCVTTTSEIFTALAQCARRLHPAT